MMSGRLNKIITIEHVKVTRTDEVTGEEITKDLEIFRARAEVEHGKGSRRNVNDEIVALYDITFVTWHYLYKDGRISEGDKVNYGGRKYVVDSLEPVESQRMVYIRCLTA